ncbi:hypothetical protein [Bradyrhizobium diazoefficiens]
MNDRLHKFAEDLDRIATGFALFQRTPPFKLDGAHHFADGASVWRCDNTLLCDKCRNDDCIHVVAAMCVEVPIFRDNAAKIYGAAEWTATAVNVVTNNLHETRNEAAFEIMTEHERVKRAASGGVSELKELAADTTAKLEAGEIEAEQAPSLSGYQRQLIMDIRANGGGAAEINHHLDLDGPRVEDDRRFLSFGVT